MGGWMCGRAGPPQERGENVVYDGEWRNADPALVQAKIAAGEPYAVRFKVRGPGVPRGVSKRCPPPPAARR